MKNPREMKSGWINTKSKLKQNFALLKDNDLIFDQDTKDEILGRIQVKLGKTKEELEAIIAGL